MVRLQRAIVIGYNREGVINEKRAEQTNKQILRVHRTSEKMFGGVPYPLSCVGRVRMVERLKQFW